MSTPSSSDDRVGGPVTIVVPVHDPPIGVLQACLASIDAQHDDRWEAVVVDDASSSPVVRAELERWCDGERRRLISRGVNGGIARATNDGLDAATGVAVVFLDHDDELTGDAVGEVLAAFADESVDLVYSDEEKIDPSGEFVSAYAKPDWSPIRHLSQHYLNHLTAVRRSALGDLRLRPEFEPTQDYDLVLRLTEQIVAAGRGIVHLDRVCYRWRAISGSSALDAGEKPEMCDAVRRSLAAAIERRGIDAEVHLAELDGVTTTVARLAWQDAIAATEITAVPIERDSTPAEVDRAVAAATTELVQLVDASDAAPDRAATVGRRLAAELIHRDGVVAAGPCLVGADGAIASAGRGVEPLLHEPFAGADDDGGHWGALLATREVGALAPVGLVARRSSWLGAGGLTAHGTLDDVDLDTALGALCIRLADAGGSSIVVPHERLSVDASWSIEELPVIERARAWRRAVGADGVVDHHAPHGRATGDRLDGSVYGHIARLVGARDVRLVTSDVFDTIVTRSTVSPSDVFVGLADRLQTAGLDSSWTASRVRAARVAAERRARRGVAERFRQHDPDATPPAPECTIEEIWDQLGPVLGIDPSVGVEAELDLEADALTLITAATELFAAIHRAGIPIVLVSDTYLSAEQLRSLLASVGVPFDPIVDVVTSSDRGKCKADGLLAEVLADRAIDPAAVLHVGDHPIADVATAEALGCLAVQVELTDHEQHVARRTDELVDWSAASGTDLGLSAQVRATLLEAGWLRRAPAYQFGVAGAGPALFGFARWIEAEAEALGVDSLHFLLREGDTIADLVARATDTQRDLRRVHASRWVDVRATIFDGSADEILAAIDRKTPIDVDHLVRAFHLPTSLAAALIGDRPVIPAGFRELAERMADDPDARAGVVAASSRLRSRVVRLLERELDLTQPTIALVDVGWGGRIQEAIVRLLTDAGHTQPVVGLYLALSDAGIERITRGFDLRCYLPSRLDDRDDPRMGDVGRDVAHHPEIIERVLMAPRPTFVDVADDGSAVLADDVEPRPPSLDAAVRGVHDLVDRLAAGTIDERWVTDGRWRRAVGSLLRDAAVVPRPGFAADAVGWSHDDLGGANTTRLDGDQRLGRLVSSTTVRDIERLLDDAPVWIEGLAAIHRPEIVALRRAQALGVPLERLAPVHPAGPVWLTVFRHGDDTPVLQTQQQLGASADDWTVIRLRGEVGDLRAVRFDPGDRATLVELGMIDVVVAGPDGRRLTASITDLRDPAVTAHAARIVDRRRLAASADGHLVIGTDWLPAAGVPSSWLTEPLPIDLAVRFRRWLLDDDDPLLRSGPLDRVERLGRRLKVRWAARRSGGAVPDGRSGPG